MNDSLNSRIDSQDEWTFAECLGLAAQFNLKVRFVIAMVFSRGKRYIDDAAYQRPARDTDGRPD